MKDLTPEAFAADVKGHTVTVLRDDGVYRHLRIAEPGTYVMGFDIVTWPGHLAYVGDMGSFVFARLTDMFEFFRGYEPNFQYWAEKCQAADKSDGLEEFSEQRFRDAVENDVASFLESNVDVDADELRAEVHDALLKGEINQYESVRDALDFSHGEFSMEDFYEHRLNEYTFRFKWCCHALPFAIGLYDAARAEQSGGAK